MNGSKEIIARAYKVFSGNKPGEYIDACTDCCMTTASAEKLKALPISTIPLALLTAYQDAAKPDTLDPSELKYFAPRYIELILNYEFPSFEPLLSLTRFGFLDRIAWSTEERKILDAFALFSFKSFLRTEYEDVNVTSIDMLLMFYKGKFKVSNLLNAWIQVPSIEGLLRFCELVDGLNFGNNGAVKVSNAFSDDGFNRCIEHWINQHTIKTHFRESMEVVILEPDEMVNASNLARLVRTYDLPDW